jgi:hypothetical protein
MNPTITIFLFAFLLGGCNSQATTPDWCTASQTAAALDEASDADEKLGIDLPSVAILEKQIETNTKVMKAFVSKGAEPDSSIDIDIRVAEARFRTFIEDQKLLTTKIIVAISDIGHRTNLSKRKRVFKMDSICRSVHGMFGVSNVAYSPLVGTLYLSLRGPEDELWLRHFGEAICRLMDANEPQFIVHVVGTEEWSKLKSTSQLAHLKDEHFIACEGNQLSGVYNNPSVEFLSILSSFQ